MPLSTTIKYTSPAASNSAITKVLIPHKMCTVCYTRILGHLPHFLPIIRKGEINKYMERISNNVIFIVSAVLGNFACPWSFKIYPPNPIVIDQQNPCCYRVFHMDGYNIPAWQFETPAGIVWKMWNKNSQIEKYLV